MTHAQLISPSGSPIWINCPVSPIACRDIDDPSGDAAMEGSIAHGLAERCLRQSIHPMKYLGWYGWYNEHDAVGLCQDAPDEKGLRKVLQVTPDMVDYIQDGYLKHVYEYLNGKQAMLTVEQRLDGEWIHPDLKGTADSLITVPLSEISLYDLKYGKGPVGPDTPQLKIYGLMALGAYNMYSVKTVRLVICQPRVSMYPKILTLSVDDLYAWGNSVLVPAIESVYAEAKFFPDSPNYNPGPWCKYCRYQSIKAQCPAHRKMIMDDMAISGLKSDERAIPTVSEPVNPSELTGEEIGRVLDVLDVFLPWADAVKKEAFDRAIHGHPNAPTNRKIVQGRATRKWALSEKKVAEQAKKYLGKTDLYMRKFLSPAQMENKLAESGFPKTVLSHMVETSYGKSMVKLSNPKEALVPGPVTEQIEA